jgi:uncharacterized membrane protein YwzB
MDIHSTTIFSMLGTWAFLPTIITVIVHIAFSAAVFADAQNLKKDEGLTFAGPIIWSLAVVVGGVFVALTYWAIHHSSLRRY